jgi:hypothetical protein
MVSVTGVFGLFGSCKNNNDTLRCAFVVLAVVAWVSCILAISSNEEARGEWVLVCIVVFFTCLARVGFFIYLKMCFPPRKRFAISPPKQNTHSLCETWKNQANTATKYVTKQLTWTCSQLKLRNRAVTMLKSASPMPMTTMHRTPRTCVSVATRTIITSRLGEYLQR